MNAVEQKKFHEELETLESASMFVDYWRNRALEAESKVTSNQLLESYVQDLIDMWPTVTMRTLGKVTQKVADLKEALSLSNK